MEAKTAMQQLLEFINELPTSNIISERIQMKAFELLSVEKSNQSTLLKKFLRWYDLSPEENASKSHSELIRKFKKYKA